MITWDKDLTFLQPEREPRIPEDNVLARRLLAIPEYRGYYFSQLDKAADLFGGPGGWADREVTRMYTLIHTAALDDPHKQCMQHGTIELDDLPFIAIIVRHASLRKIFRSDEYLR